MVISDRVLRLAQQGGWVGVDWDGTMFTFEGDTWVAWNVFGQPIQAMIDRVKAWVAAGVPVRIVTARIRIPLEELNGLPVYSRRPLNTCIVTGQAYSDAMMSRAIQDHAEKHGLPRLLVQCYKGARMIELWDDRAVQVVPNTGQTLTEEHAAELSALRGRGPMLDSELDPNPANWSFMK